MNENDTDGLQQICRVCLEKSSKMYPLVGPIVNVDIDVSTMITYCTSIELSLDEDLPKGVCIPCFRTIRIAYNFICQFKEANQKLLEERELSRFKPDNDTQQNYIIEELDYTVETEEGTLLEHDFKDEMEEEKIIITCVGETLDNEIIEELDPPNISQNETSEYEEDNDTPESNEKSTVTTIPASKIHCGQSRRKINKSYICPVCLKRLRSFDSGFIPHLHASHKDEMIKCSKCPLEMLLSVEMYIQHYKRVHLYQCYMCHRSFGRKSSLYYHMKVHNASKSYECSFANCKKSFLTSWSLNKHMNTHSDAIKYICSKCGSKFNTYDTFRYHQKTHDGNRNHLCPECGRAFLQSVHLKYHMWKHTGIKQFHCDKCSKSYTSITQLKKHKRKYCGAVKEESKPVEVMTACHFNRT